VIGGGRSLLFQAYRPGRSAVPGDLTNDGNLNSVNIFGGTERNVKDRNFRGGTLFACFGGFQIDLTQAEIEGERAVIDATAVFGGGEIRVPQSWNVMVEGMGIFGGYEDSTRHVPSDGQPKKTLIVRGAAVFGGVEVKN
jgi:Cell wall-active antibiotics response 4TMS YvqF